MSSTLLHHRILSSSSSSSSSSSLGNRCLSPWPICFCTRAHTRARSSLCTPITFAPPPGSQCLLNQSETVRKGRKGVTIACASSEEGRDLLAHHHGSVLPTSGPYRWSFGEGIARDIMRRLPHYGSDFVDGIHPKAAASVFFLYFACLAPCIAFGGLISHLTGGLIGVIETVVATSGAGILYALTAGQPLTLLGPTGLMVIFCGLLYKATVQFSLPFLPIYGWVGIWSCIFLVILAAIEASDLIQHFTRFTDEIFSALISLGYIAEACKSIRNLFKPSSPFTTEAALLSFVLAGSTWSLASVLSELRNSRFFVRPLRDALADFGPPLAILLMSTSSHCLFPSIRLPELCIPSTFSTTSGRPWLVPLFNIPSWAIAMSTLPAALLTLLVFLDQGVG